MNPEGRELLEAIRADRGKTLPMHEVLAERDPAFLRGYNEIFLAAQSDSNGLPGHVRELIVMALDIVTGADPAVARAHGRKAVSMGATESQVLGAVELAVLVLAGRGLSYLPAVCGGESS